MTDIGKFALVAQGVYCNQKVFMITGEDLEYLSFVLNSKIVTWYVHLSGVSTNFGPRQWDKYVVQEIPVPKVTSEERGLLGRLTVQVANNSKSDQASLNWIDELEDAVYDVFELNSKEKNWIRSKFKNS